MVLRIDEQWNASLSPAARSANKYQERFLASTVAGERQRCEIRESGVYGTNCSFADGGIRERKGSLETPLESRVCADTANDYVDKK